MQTLTRPQAPQVNRPPRPAVNRTLRPQRRRQFPPLMLVGTMVTMVVALGAGVFFVARPYFASHAAAVNGNCSLIVPAQPLTAQGLATPYQLLATDPNQGACHEADAGQAAFVQGAVFDPATGQISIYNPLVVDQGKQPAAQPVVPQLPQGAIVALWFGFNGTNLTLKNAQNSLQDGKCINGSRNSIFGQFAYCNAPAFFAAANQAIQAGKLVPPALGTGKDGMVCPTVRDFSVVDMDQSDNVTTTYLVDGNGNTAQMNATNAAKLQNVNVQVQVNGSDNRLLAVALDGALGCSPWTAPDLTDPGHTVPALPLDELQAAAHQAAPVALSPNRHAMAKVNNKINLHKLNLYREGVDQPDSPNGSRSSTTTYCKNLLAIAPMRLLADASLTKQHASPDPAAANNLFTFLAQRFNATWGANGLDCQALLRKNSPIKVTNDANGVAIDATINGMSVAPVDNTTNCTMNGTVIKGCVGMITVNGQQCSFLFDKTTNQVNINCQAAMTPPATQSGAGTPQGQIPATNQGVSADDTAPNN